MNHTARTRTVALAGMFAAAAAVAQHSPAPVHDGFTDPALGSRQLVLVITPAWDASSGTIRTFERGSDLDPWLEVHEQMSMTLGSKGLGWGSGLHGSAIGDGPVKKEGDNRSPAGVFTLDMLYGYAPESEAARFSMPYLPLDSADECIDDPSSVYYNMVVDRKNVRTVDWKSSERMNRSGKYYEWGIIVGHNKDPRIAGGGSCIFLHVWGGNTEPTSGCTSLDRESLLAIMEWLSPTAHPILVQLPESEYRARREAWSLP